MTTAVVARKLGGRAVLRRQVTSELGLARVVREGLPVATLDFVIAQLERAHVTDAEVYGVVRNSRTLRRKRKDGAGLSPRESDRLARLARLIVRAEEVLGDGAHRWLVRPNRALAGNRPLSLLDTDAGAVAVERSLGRIEHGLYG